MKNGKLFLALLALFVIALLTGCVRDSDTKSSPPPETGIISPAASDSGGTDKKDETESAAPSTGTSESNTPTAGTSGNASGSADSEKTDEVLNSIIDQLDDLEKLYSELEQDDFTE